MLTIFFKTVKKCYKNLHNCIVWYKFTTKTNPMKTFGNFVKEKRIEKKITLRTFCKTVEIDPSNWSKIERGLLPPPKSSVVLERIAEALELKKNSDEYHTLMDLAVLSYIPTGIVDEDILKKLPVFFRTLRGEKPTDEELRKLIDKMKE